MNHDPHILDAFSELLKDPENPDNQATLESMGMYERDDKTPEHEKRIEEVRRQSNTREGDTEHDT